MRHVNCILNLLYIRTHVAVMKFIKIRYLALLINYAKELFDFVKQSRQGISIAP